MKEIKFNYDIKYDDLFVYSEKKSDSSIEIGDFVFDFTYKGELVAFQIRNALKNLNRISEKPFESLERLKSCKIEINSIKGYFIIKLELTTENDVIYSNIVVPSIKNRIPEINF